jgi:hypothetical protein
MDDNKHKFNINASGYVPKSQRQTVISYLTIGQDRICSRTRRQQRWKRKTKSKQLLQ